MKVIRTKGRIKFKEVQTFNQPWLWIIIIGFPAVIVIGFMAFLNSNEDKFTEMFIAILIVILVGVLMILLLKSLQLETVISDEGIFYRWYPFFKKYDQISWDEITNASLVTWMENAKTGNKYTKKKTNFVGGKYGLQLTLRDGTLVYMGSQKPSVMFKSAEEYLSGKIADPT